jgi:tetratricopeptide (TPR) repeat protein
MIKISGISQYILIGFILSVFLWESGAEAKSEDFLKGRHYQYLGQHSRALIYYRTYLNGDPSKRYEEEARFRLAETSYEMGSYVDAGNYFQQYLKLYPDGEYRPEAKKYLSEIQEKSRQVTAQASEMQPMNVREARIERLEQQTETRPDDAMLWVQLAEAYLDVEETGLAGRALEKAEQKAEKYQEMKDIRSTWKRLEMIDKRAPIRPTDLYGNPGPLRVEQANGGLRTNFRPSDEFQYNTYTVTGFVVNEGKETFKNVRIDVVLFDFAGKIIETKTVPVGQVGPLDRRAFSASLYVHRSVMDQVHRFECRILY